MEIRRKLTVFTIAGLACALTIANAQEIRPELYWNFEGQDQLKSTIPGTKSLNAKNYNCPVSKIGSVVGSGLDLQRKPCLVVVPTVKEFAGNGFTIEFLFKGSQFEFQSFPKRDFYIRLTSGGILFRTTHLVKGNSPLVNDVTVNFKGSDRNSYHYYVDEQWHHFVFSWDKKTGEKSIWVDGQSPEGFSKKVDANAELAYSGGNGFRSTDQLDELAFYSTALPQNLIEQHASEARRGTSYSFRVREIRRAEEEVQVRAAPSHGTTVDPNEFAPGFPEYSQSATDQLKSYPLPRFYPDNDLKRNVSWMDIMYLHRELQGKGGKGFGQTSPARAVELSKEMADYWNYYLDIPVLRTNAAGAEKNYSNPGTVYGALVDFANRNTGYPYTTILFHAQLRPSQAGFQSNVPNVSSQQLPDEYYLRDEQGKPVVYNKRKWLSPLMPLDKIVEDGKTSAFYLAQLLKYLHRQPALINENGETFGHSRKEELFKLDPRVWNDYKKSGLSLAEYNGRFQYRIDSAYRETILTTLNIRNTPFSIYNTSAIQSEYWPDYAKRRNVNKWNQMYYSTPDFYPRTPDNWQVARGAFNGYGVIADGRKREIELGDKFFSPFVSAGWGSEEVNIRPAQYLSLLKSMVMLGADFFYAGYFNITGKGGKWPNGFGPNDPRGYIYQLAMPSYAQALRTWVPEFFDKGKLLNPQSNNERYKHFRFRGKSEAELILVRQSGKKYLIFGSIQPSSNIKGNVPDSKITTIELDGKNVTFQIRRQGSVYVLDLGNAAPVFYQLDKWHQYEHPSYWSRNIILEAEMFSGSEGPVSIRTINNNGYDFSTFSTDVILSGGSSISFQSKFKLPGNVNVEVVASSEGDKPAVLELNINGKKEEVQVAGRKQTAYQLKNKFSSKDISQVRLSVRSGRVAVDRISFLVN